MPLTVGTAGHVDHGKTWLVRALTGKDTDRLPEEQARGISIDLGYAPLELADGRRLSLIDVPGHERFVRNMVAGATGIDLFLLVIDAAEGARAQTHEHLAILALLGIERGVVAVTKADSVDAETLELAVEEARELVPGAEVIAVSAKTGAGLEELRAALGRASDFVLEQHKLELPSPSLRRPRLHARRDRNRRHRDALVGLDRPGRRPPSGAARSRRPGSERPGARRAVARAEAGQRVALSLPGIERRRLRRGDVLIAPGTYATSYRLDVVLEELEPIADGARLLVYHGTSTVLGRVVRSGDRFAQLRLAAPVVAARGDRFVLREATTRRRRPDPRSDAAPTRRRRPLRAFRARRGDDSRAGARATVNGGTPTRGSRSSRLTLTRADRDRRSARPGRRRADRARGRRTCCRGFRSSAAARASISRASAPSLGAREQRRPRSRRNSPRRAPERSGWTTASSPASSRGAGRLVRLGDGYAISTSAYERARTLVVEECTAAGRIALARFRDLAGCGRRDAQLLLERLDADGVTRRVGDERVLRRRG